MWMMNPTINHVSEEEAEGQVRAQALLATEAAHPQGGGGTEYGHSAVR